MLAIIPAAGRGTRFLPVTRVIPKEMLPIGAKPALELIVDEARAAGATKIILIISHEKEIIREYFKDAPDIVFVYQEEQRGLGHAILQVADIVGEARSVASEENSRVLILLGDALVSGCAASSEMVALSQSRGNASVIGCEYVPDEKVSRYGILKLSSTGGTRSVASDAEPRVVDLVEKPTLEEAPSNLAVAARYLLSGDIFAYLKTQTPGKGGEIQLTDAIRRMIADGSHVLLPYVYPGRRHDIGNPKGYFETLQAYNAAANVS